MDIHLQVSDLVRNLAEFSQHFALKGCPLWLSQTEGFPIFGYPGSQKKTFISSGVGPQDPWVSQDEDSLSACCSADEPKNRELHFVLGEYMHKGTPMKTIYSDCKVGLWMHL